MMTFGMSGCSSDDDENGGSGDGDKKTATVSGCTFVTSDGICKLYFPNSNSVQLYSNGSTSYETFLFTTNGTSVTICDNQGTQVATGTITVKDNVVDTIAVTSTGYDTITTYYNTAKYNYTYSGASGTPEEDPEEDPQTTEQTTVVYSGTIESTYTVKVTINIDASGTKTIDENNSGINGKGSSFSLSGDAITIRIVNSGGSFEALYTGTVADDKITINQKFGSDIDPHYLNKQDNSGSAATDGITLKTKPDAIGDIVLNDGTACALAEGATLTSELKAKAVAVIFYIGTECTNSDSDKGTRMLGVGLNNTASTWEGCLKWVAESTLGGYTTKIPTVCNRDSGKLSCLGICKQLCGEQ